MSLYTLLGIAIGLAMDAFAVSVATSIKLRKVSPRQIFRFAWHFGLFQALMPVLGWGLGHSMLRWIESWDHWIAFILLSIVGGKAIYEALQSEEMETADKQKDPTRGMSLLILSIATSIDAMAVGLSFAVLQVSLLSAVCTIGIVTAILTTIGMKFGAHLGNRFGQRVEILGGLILIGIGTRILLEHTLFAGH